MHRPAQPRRSDGRYSVSALKHLLGFLFAFAIVLSSGCTSFKLPGLNFGQDEAPSLAFVNGGAAGFGESMNMTIYQQVRQAEAENAVVLHIAGDADDPARILPLPADGQSVFVSTLLTQANIHKKLGLVDVVVYRCSPNVIGGVRMEVHMSGMTVRPETDYSLRAGDRIHVKKAKSIGLEGLISATLGL